MPSQPFEDLEVWKRSCRLAVFVYETLKNHSDFGMRDQMQRSIVSLASNIAEGSERSPRDFRRFLKIALGSSAELRTQTWIAAHVGIITEEQASHIVEETKHISRMLVGLSKSITKSLANTPKPTRKRPTQPPDTP